MLSKYRVNPPKEIGEFAVTDIQDYQCGINGLPKTNMLEFHLADNCKVMIRPSGTEPNLKAYIFSCAENRISAQSKILKIRNWLDINTKQ